MTVTVHVWLPEGYESTFSLVAQGLIEVGKFLSGNSRKPELSPGHASIQVKSSRYDMYASFYPEDAKHSGTLKNVKSESRRYADDCKNLDKQILEHHLFKIDGMDEGQIVKSWETVKNRDYNLAELNCSSVVAYLLGRGGDPLMEKYNRAEKLMTEEEIKNIWDSYQVPVIRRQAAKVLTAKQISKFVYEMLGQKIILDERIQELKDVARYHAQPSDIFEIAQLLEIYSNIVKEKRIR